MKISDFFYGYLIKHQSLRIHGFGRFKTETKEAYMHPIDHEVSPVGLKLSFFLDKDVNDDGFLDFAAEKSGQSVAQCTELLRKEKESWIKSLKVGQAVDFKFLGQLKINKGGTVVFIQNEELSLDPRFFGLSSFKLEPLKKVESPTSAKQVSKPLEPVKKRKWGIWIAAASLVLVLGASYWFFGEELMQWVQKPLAENTEEPEQSQVEPQESQATTDTVEQISYVDTTETEALDTINELTVNDVDSFKENEVIVDEAPEVQPVEAKPVKAPETQLASTSSKKYLLIAGCFQEAQKADEYLIQIREKGYPASIEGKTKGGLIRVCYGTYDSWSEAARASRKINQEEGGSSWVQKR